MLDGAARDFSDSGMLALALPTGVNRMKIKPSSAPGRVFFAVALLVLAALRSACATPVVLNGSFESPVIPPNSVMAGGGDFWTGLARPPSRSCASTHGTDAAASMYGCYGGGAQDFGCGRQSLN
jgi:hypothetical protein